MKPQLAQQVINRHKDKQILLIGMYIDQLKKIAGDLDIPLITGSTSQPKRDALYRQLKAGDIQNMDTVDL